MSYDAIAGIFMLCIVFVIIAVIIFKLEDKGD